MPIAWKLSSNRNDIRSAVSTPCSYKKKNIQNNFCCKTAARMFTAWYLNWPNTKRNNFAVKIWRARRKHQKKNLGRTRDKIPVYPLLSLSLEDWKKSICIWSIRESILDGNAWDHVHMPGGHKLKGKINPACILSLSQHYNKRIQFTSQFSSLMFMNNLAEIIIDKLLQVGIRRKVVRILQVQNWTRKRKWCLKETTR